MIGEALTISGTPAIEMLTPENAAIFVSLELSRSTWLMTALAAPLGAKMSRYQVRGGDVPDLLKRFSDLQHAVQRRTGQLVPVVVIQEAGLDGFWIHRALVALGFESHVVDPASIAVSRRHRRAKTDRIDGEALVRTLMAWRRGDRQALISAVSEQATTLIADESFIRVREMMTALENINAAGLPCFRGARYLTAGGDDDAYDLRDRDWGAGTRVIIEMAFVWE